MIAPPLRHIQVFHCTYLHHHSLLIIQLNVFAWFSCKLHTTYKNVQYHCCSICDFHGSYNRKWLKCSLCAYNIIILRGREASSSLIDDRLPSMINSKTFLDLIILRLFIFVVDGLSSRRRYRKDRSRPIYGLFSAHNG